MLIPVRCFTCGKPLAQLWDKFQEEVGKGKAASEVFEKLGVERYCCKRMLMSTIDYSGEVNEFKKG